MSFILVPKEFQSMHFFSQYTLSMNILWHVYTVEHKSAKKKGISPSIHDNINEFHRYYTWRKTQKNTYYEIPFIWNSRQN